MALINKIRVLFSEVVGALGYTPENPANKGIANGYAGLDASGRVPAGQLPSYVDDVQEFPNLASFPNPGSSGIIYLALDTNIIYRWSGSTYIEIASGDVAWSDITGKPTFGTLSGQDANSVNITGGTVNATSSVIGNLSLATNEITSTQASDDILITPTGIGALKVQNRITLEDRLSFGPTDPQGSYFANNAEYLQSGPLSAWSYLQNGTATKVEFDNGAAMAIANAASGNAGDLILGWTEVLNISSAGDVVTGNWTAGIIDSAYGGTGVDNSGKTLTITANASISGTNTGDQTNITGNAGTATKLQTARTINGVAFDGTANITIATATSNNLTIASPLTGGSFNGSAPTTIGIPTANSTVTGALSSANWVTFNAKQAALSGAGIVKSTNGTISYLTDNSANWNTAYNHSLTSATVTGTTTKTLTLNQQGGTNITASWSDLNTDAVTSVFGRTGAVVAAEGDYSLTQLGDVDLASPVNGQLLQNNGTRWVNWTPNYLTSNQVVTLSGDVTGTGATAITATLANTTVTAGTYGSVTQVPQITIDSKGRATSAANVTITPGWSSITGTPTTVSGYGITDAATLTGSQTLTNKTVTDATFAIIDDADNTKKAQFQASEIATTTTRTYTLPNVNGTLVTTGDTGSVTNTMLAGSIADTKLNIITTAGKVDNSATTAASANTANAIVARDANGGFAATNVNLSGQLTITRANNTGTGLGQIYLNGATSNRIDFATSGIGIPSTTTRSVGTRLVFYPQVAASLVDFGMGISLYTLWYSVPATSYNHTFYTGTTVSYRISDAGASSRGAIYEGNSQITTQNTAVTLTIAQLLTLVIQTTPTANITFTLPTGTNTDAGVMSGLETFRSFTWSILNTAAFTVTMVGNTGMTYVGNTTIAANTSASFRTIKTATNTFTTYRI